MAFLMDGFPTTIAFSTSAGILNVIREKDVTPPSMEGGGPNDTTTMRNTRWRTKQPKKLLTLGQMQFTCAYDPLFYNELVDSMQVNQVITVDFSDTELTNLQFWGWLDGLKPNPIKEGEQPTAVATVECSNQDNDGNEQAPFASAA